MCSLFSAGFDRTVLTWPWESAGSRKTDREKGSKIKQKKRRRKKQKEKGRCYLFSSLRKILENSSCFLLSSCYLFFSVSLPWIHIFLLYHLLCHATVPAYLLITIFCFSTHEPPLLHNSSNLLSLHPLDACHPVVAPPWPSGYNHRVALPKFVYDQKQHLFFPQSMRHSN